MLAAVRILFAEHKVVGVGLYLNNKAVVEVFATPARQSAAVAGV